MIDVLIVIALTLVGVPLARRQLRAECRRVVRPFGFAIPGGESIGLTFGGFAVLTSPHVPPGQAFVFQNEDLIYVNKPTAALITNVGL